MLVMLIPFSNNIFLAASMSQRRASVSMRSSFTRLRMSVFEATCVMFDLSERHRGHTHVARNLMQEIRILKEMSVLDYIEKYEAYFSG